MPHISWYVATHAKAKKERFCGFEQNSSDVLQKRFVSGPRMRLDRRVYLLLPVSMVLCAYGGFGYPATQRYFYPIACFPSSRVVRGRQRRLLDGAMDLG